MDPDIDSDLKKARAFLAAFSTAVLLAWYFSADLRTINIIGFSLTIRDNAHNLWMVIAFINLHFLLRYVQKLPEEARLPDDAMQIAFEKTLISHVASAYHRYFLAIVERDEKLAPDPGRAWRILRLHANGRMLYRKKFEEAEDKGKTISQYRLFCGDRIHYKIVYEYLTESGGNGISHSPGCELEPNLCAVLYSRILGFLRGVVFTPWMSEYILPVMLGLSSISVAIITWWAVNYGSA